MGNDLLKLIADYFKILSEPLRLKIIYSVKDGEKCVNEIVRDVRSSQPNVSKHLSLLIKAGLINRRQEKNSVYYSISDDRLLQICGFRPPGACEGKMDLPTIETTKRTW